MAMIVNASLTAARAARQAHQMAIGQHKLGAKRLEQYAPLDGHAVRHGQHELVPPRRRNKGQPYASVAAGWLHLQSKEG